MKLKVSSRIMALDIGFNNTGVAIYDKAAGGFIYSEVIQTAKDKSIPAARDNVRRCRQICKRLLALVRVFRPRMIVGEVPNGGGQSFHAMSAMAMATALTSAFVESVSLPFFHVTPNDIKRIVAKKGPVSKQQVQGFIEVRFGKTCLPKLLGEREHVADAMAALAVYLDR